MQECTWKGALLTVWAKYKVRVFTESFHHMRFVIYVITGRLVKELYKQRKNYKNFDWIFFFFFFFFWGGRLLAV